MGEFAGSESHSARHLALLQHAERITGLGSWEWTPQTGEMLWSDNLFRLFGFGPGEIAPSPESLVLRVHPDDRQLVEELLREALAGEFGERTIQCRIVCPGGTLVPLQVIVVDIDPSTSLPRRIVGAVNDVTLQRRMDRTLAAHLAVTRALDEWRSLEQGAHGLLARLSAAMDLAFCALWIPEGSTLAARALWHLPAPAVEPVVEPTRRWRPGLGSASVGRAFVSRQPVVSAGPSEAGPAERRAAIRRAGLRGSMAVPAVSLDETLAVVELLSFEPIDATERLVRALDGIGHEIGHFLSRRRGELTAPVLTTRELAVLQLAAQGRAAAEIAVELHLSPATVKRHFERSYAALDVSDRAAAVGEAMRRGLIT